MSSHKDICRQKIHSYDPAGGGIKYMHNVFGAYKVTYFNTVQSESRESSLSMPSQSCEDAVNACREYCEQMGADWRKVHTGVLLSGYINDTHTYVPDPDGKFGYGGKFFPKDVNVFAKMTEGTPWALCLSTSTSSMFTSEEWRSIFKR